jgi:hypothetical protein
VAHREEEVWSKTVIGTGRDMYEMYETLSIYGGVPVVGSGFWLFLRRLKQYSQRKTSYIPHRGVRIT